MSAGLLDPDRRLRASAFEDAVLRCLGPVEPEAWARAYQALARALTVDRGGLSALPSAELAIHHREAVAGLVHAARTFLVASELLAAFPVAGRLTEVGAGWGPFGLAAAARGLHVTLVDRSEGILGRARGLFQAAGLEPPAVHVGGADEALEGAEGSVALPFLLNELVAQRGPVAAAEAVRAWLRGPRAPGDRLFLLEPGTPAAAELVERLRDDMGEVATIYGPCLGARRCPRLGTRDWCHFAWRLPLGEVARGIGQRAGIDPTSGKVSWLVLGAREGDPQASTKGWLGRVLEVRGRGKGKSEVSFCTASGEQRVEVLWRSGGREWLDQVRPGAVVSSAQDPGRRAEPSSLRFESERAVIL